MTTLIDITPNWPTYLLAICSVLLTFAGMLACGRIRSLKTQLMAAKTGLDDTQLRLEIALQENADLEEASLQNESVIRQLREENTEYRIRAEERSNQYDLEKHQAQGWFQELKKLTLQNSRLETELTKVKTAADKEQKFNHERQKILEQSRAQLKQELQILANSILENNTTKLAANNETQLKQVLNPVREQLHVFQKKVEDVYEKEAKQRFSLAGEINKLQNLNERISEDAVALTRALKGENKVAGTWGEVILERLLESSGLAKGREFEVQSSQSSQSGKRLQPDVMVRLPHGKSVIIDSKVSLVGYEKLYSAESEEQKLLAAREHLASVRQHVRRLGKKNYQQIEGLQTLDFVLLFIPVEGAFLTAVQQDSQLLTDSYQQNIVLVSPSTLLSTLRVIHNLWQQDQQNKNAQEIARQAGNLYDKFASFGQDLLAIGQRLDQSQSAYHQAVERLSSGRGNLLTRVENLKKLGARVSKQIPSELVIVNQNHL